MANDAAGLTFPDGKPLLREPRITVIKVPAGVHLPQQFLATIAKATQGAVVEIPFTSELLSGKMALAEIDSIHHICHAIQNQADVQFSKEELHTLHKAIEFLCTRTSPGENSKEAQLLIKVTTALS